MALCRASPALAASISGIVSYSGRQTGAIRVVACTASNSWSSNYGTTLATTGAYTIAGIPTGSNYWLKAWMDSNGNGSNDVPEARGALPGNPANVLADVGDMNFTLIDPDADRDGLPDWWEIKFGLNPTNRPSGGDGRHGSLVVTSHLTVEQLYGQVRLPDDPPTYDPSDPKAIPNLTDLKITDSAILSVNAWNGTNGGVLALKVQGTLEIDNGSAIDVTGKGYRGGLLHGGATFGQQGESYTGLGEPSQSANGGGGGGGQCDRTSFYYVGGGGGGGYGTPGSNGIDRAERAPVAQGRGGSVYGSPSLETVFLGSGGGHGGGALSHGCDGGAGGGAIIVAASNLMCLGSIRAPGSSGDNPPEEGYGLGGGGGGGSGGSVLLTVSKALIGTNRVTALGGLDGADSHYGPAPGGAGGMGRIRVDTELPHSGLTSPGATSTPIAWILPDGALDTDGDGLPNILEYQRGTDPTNRDTDADGMPDGWEVDNGLDPLVDDAQGDADGDELRNFREFTLGTRANDLDSDGDGLADYDDLFVYGTSPTSPDTDHDGMPDGWEVTHGLNPLVDDANGDLDLDSVSNLHEYLNGLDPSKADSIGDRQSDYERLYGQKGATCYYDKNDRLVGIDYNRGARGFAIAYGYDGNGNIIRQKYFARDANSNGLPDLWEYLCGLTNATRFGDADGDGWPNFREWLAGSDPNDPSSVPGVRGAVGTTAAMVQVGFAPFNFVMAVGDVNGDGNSEIVVGADGNSGAITNSILILSQTVTGWTTQRVDVGCVGVTSIAIGQPNSMPSSAIYVGTRQTGGTGAIMQVAMTAGGWQTATLPIDNTGQVAYVLGVRQGYDVLAELARTNAPDMALYSLCLCSNVWSAQVADASASHRGLGVTASRSGSSACVALRVLDAGGIQYGGAGFLTTGASNGVVKALVVGGGGAGGGSSDNYQAGGGGAGGMVYDGTHTVVAGDYPVTVGNGGDGSSWNNGGNSVFDTMTAIGGGRGARAFFDGGVYGGFSGGSGGGAASSGSQYQQPGGAGTPGQGYAGGGNGDPYGYGGGGRWRSRTRRI